MSTEIRIEGDTLYMTRVFAAPREQVFEAWVETSKVQQWWGCAQTTNVRSEIEPRVGGSYTHMMTLDGMGEMPRSMCAAVFTEYDPPKRLAYAPPAAESDDDTDASAPTGMTVTVDFVEVDGGTEVRLVHSGLPTEARPFVRAGWGAAMDKLHAFLRAESVA